MPRVRKSRRLPGKTEVRVVIADYAKVIKEAEEERQAIIDLLNEIKSGDEVTLLLLMREQNIKFFFLLR